MHMKCLEHSLTHSSAKHGVITTSTATKLCEECQGSNWEAWGRPHRGEDAGTKFEMSRVLQMAWKEKAFAAGGARAWR